MNTDWKTCFKGKRILIAEDDAVSRDLMSDIFELMGCSAEFTVDGNQVVEKFQKGTFDLIFMDVRMPNKDGVSATKEIRALEKGGKRVPIIALTASILVEDRQMCIEAGVDEFISKPIHLDDLRSKMAKFLLSGK
jgi:two-component system, sensor histidine kinase and response regulator